MKAVLSCSIFTRLLFAIVAALLLSSCAQIFTSANDIHKLPVNRGQNLGSLIAWTSWKYLGATRDDYVFFYYYNVDNLLRHRKVRIPRHLATLHFPAAPLTHGGQWVTLRQEGDRLHFYADHSLEEMKKKSRH
jgi:hypothetical protein